jgi:hypothetical protein
MITTLSEDADMADPKIDPSLETHIQAFEEMLNQKETLLAAHAGLWPRFGPQGVATVLKHRQFAVLKNSLRNKDNEAKETALKEAVESSDKWGDFLKEFEAGRKAYIDSKFAIDMLNARLQLAATRLRLLGLTLSLPAADDPSEDDDAEA